MSTINQIIPLKRNYIIFLLIFISGAMLKAQDYKLVWEDNFNNSVLDTSKWNIVINGRGGGNRELQYYRAENVMVGKEPVTGEQCLIITAKKESFHFRKFTSGKITTQGKLDFRYGKLEARIKLPHTANGLWPAYWMLGNDYPKAIWPKCGEIDILEMGNKNGIQDGTQDRYFGGACHWGEKFNHGRYPNFSKATTSDYSLQDDFHLYTLIWDESNLKMYLDLDKYPNKKPYFEMPINGENIPNKAAYYFHKPFFLILNLAVGGNFTQIRDTRKITALQNGDAKMYIDFIRLYQKENSHQLLTIINYPIQNK
jgi:beta-glucanase (GH16 family)